MAGSYFKHEVSPPMSRRSWPQLSRLSSVSTLRRREAAAVRHPRAAKPGQAMHHALAARVVHRVTQQAAGADAEARQPLGTRGLPLGEAGYLIQG